MKDTTQATITAAVFIPLAQAVVTGGLGGVCVGSLAWSFQADTPAAIGLTAGALISTASWLALRHNWEKRLEEMLGLVSPGQPAPAVFNQTVHLEVISEKGRAGDYLDLPGGMDRLQTLARGLVAGKSFSGRTWSNSGGLYSPGEFEQLRGELIARGLARWRSEHDHRGGATLSAKGWATMRGLANHPPTSGGLHVQPANSLVNQQTHNRHTAGEEE